MIGGATKSQLCASELQLNGNQGSNFSGTISEGKNRARSSSSSPGFTNSNPRMKRQLTCSDHLVPEPGPEEPEDSSCLVSSPRRLRAAPAEVKISPTRLELLILRFLPPTIRKSQRMRQLQIWICFDSSKTPSHRHLIIFKSLCRDRWTLIDPRFRIKTITMKSATDLS